MAYKIGTKQTTKSVESRQAIQVYVARDADSKLIRGIVALSEKESIPIKWFDSMADLGKECGIDVGAAMAAVVSDEK
ncbi:ribosomal L7Ae/L30e/S12e/Gadd45 family protein [Paenibacillus pasadenensis]|uniref:ribosomal L7Ae/L30e/S12e/Gadd45 family protein n=1 Tax=Paenibacillus pasadenensis TaxID=217090 RepID=UPI00203C47FD|nr:ribosomal L7Ae/L30e/S12e/Gadd45 family protein [Paenibacillus pasadenensis]MCM3750147.1 ribosomal L7Ae/L30e/S12e/Gadd45 family protein [Paenibacillus pasadenensis]